MKYLQSYKCYRHTQIPLEASYMREKAQIIIYECFLFVSFMFFTRGKHKNCNWLKAALLINAEMCVNELLLSSTLRDLYRPLFQLRRKWKSQKFISSYFSLSQKDENYLSYVTARQNVEAQEVV